MPLPAKPPSAELAPLVEARRLDAMAAGLVMIGWPILVFAALALGVPEIVAGVLCAIGLGVFGFFLMGFATLHRVRARKVQERLREFESIAPKYTVDCRIDEFLTIHDCGILWREGDQLRFEGLESGFSIPSDAILEIKPDIDSSHWDAQFTLRKGRVGSRVFLRATGANRSGLAQFVVDWKFARPYQGGEAESRALIRRRRVNLKPYLTFVVPCLPLAIYLVAIGPDHRALFVPYALFSLFGFCRYWMERRKLLTQL